MQVPEDSEVFDALRGVDDPEAGMNIVDLGLIYAVRSDPRGIEIDMTMTTPACPVAEMLVGQASAAVEAIAPPGTRVQVNLLWDPIWNPSMMSGVAREFFGWER